MNFEYVKKNFIYILFVLVIITIVVSTLYFQVFSKKDVFKPNVLTQPRVETPQNPVPGGVYEYSSPKQVEIRSKQASVSAMLVKLPYQGKYFYLYYQYNTGTFILELQKGKESLGEKEYEKFLKENGIEDRTWIQKIITRVY